MKPFTTFRGAIGFLDTANVDTDQIIAKQFLKSIKRTGFGEALFFDWRYLPEGQPNPEFSLNKPEAQGASILVARNNFGCGSSREHAVWAVKQYGFDVVIAPYRQNGDVRIPAFADIFRNNSFKNALLTIELSDKEVDQIFSLATEGKKLEATVNLETQTIIVHASADQVFKFEMDAAIKHRLLEGLDDIGITLQSEKDIAGFETRHQTQIFA